MKEPIRSEMKALRDELSWDQVLALSNRIHSRLLKDESYARAKRVMFYVSKGNEVFTHAMISKAFEDKTVIVPAIDNGKMNAYAVGSMDAMSPGAFGILEPIDRTSVFPKRDIDLVIVPMLAFDDMKHRVGYGKGFYDAFLNNMVCDTVGLAYEFQKTDKIPSKNHDVELDKIITEKNTY